MPSTFQCPSCEFRFRIEDKFLGRVIVCPAEGCEQKVRLTKPDQPAPEPESSKPARQSSRAVAQQQRRSRSADSSTPAQSARTGGDSQNESPARTPRRSAAVEPESKRLSESPSRNRESARNRASARERRRDRRRREAAPAKRGLSQTHQLILMSSVACLLLAGAAWGGWKLLQGSGMEADIVAVGDRQSSADPQDSHSSDSAARTNKPAGRPDQATAGGAVVTASEPSPEEQRANAAVLAKAKAKAVSRQEKLDTVVRPFLRKYCGDCHGSDSEEAGVNIDTLTSVDQFLSDHGTWERVYRMLNAGAMPPADFEPLPNTEERKEVVEYLYDELYNFDCDLVYDPGRPTIQRLNRAEYNNTIQDLFGISITPADNFPADDVGNGFDNIGDVLTVPPLLMEKYLTAAEQIAEEVIDTKDYSKPMTITRAGGQLQSNRNDSLEKGVRWLNTNGLVYADFEIPAAGAYEIYVTAMATQMGNERAKFELQVGEKKEGVRTVQRDRRLEDFKHRAILKQGKIRITTTFLNDAYNKQTKADRNMGFGKIEVRGPLGGFRDFKRKPSHERLITAVPGNDRSVVDAASEVLRPLLRRAFRRPVNEAEVGRFAGLVQMAVSQLGETYEGGISLALQAILVSPDFLFRIEQDPPAGAKERQLNSHELASRLSYFLWSTMPDDELFGYADSGRLSDPAILRAQIQRMLKDDRAESLVQNFAAQWLNLRNLDDVTPDPTKFKVFNNGLRDSMRRETELLFLSVIQEDRSVRDLLSADYTFVNKQLAQHYGIAGVNGNNFERVSLQGTKRSGVLTHASILTLTSDPGRTSPVKRGKWIMENIFGEAPPPPPPDVPELEETAEATPGASLREQLEKHREDPGCASCHRVMDPLGLGLENFDAIGRWRDQDKGKPIDSSGELPSGEKFSGALQLVSVVQQREEKFYRTLTEKMLTYAVGRGTKYFDRCAVDQCINSMRQRNNRFSALIEGIVLSDPFQKRAANVPKTAKVGE